MSLARVLILSGSGMLGHKIYQVLSEDFNVNVTFRNFDEKLKHTDIFRKEDALDGVDAKNFNAIEKLVENYKPKFVINCIGIIKQLKEAKNPKLSIYTNSLFPHLLAELCKKYNTKLIHISTDCVFSGNKGNYTESDNPDPVDLYGRSKLLGEVSIEPHLTLRTSIIGHELFSNVSLVDWFLSNSGGKVNGFVNAIYTGFPTIILANEIKRIINDFPDLSGLYHISSERINKYELINKIKKVYKLDTEINPFEEFRLDRSLNSDKYRKATHFTPPSWDEMIIAMHNDYLNNYTFRN